MQAKGGRLNGGKLIEVDALAARLWVELLQLIEDLLASLSRGREGLLAGLKVL
jgi:hypothetical protein